MLHPGGQASLQACLRPSRASHHASSARVAASAARNVGMPAASSRSTNRSYCGPTSATSTHGFVVACQAAQALGDRRALVAALLLLEPRGDHDEALAGPARPARRARLWQRRPGSSPARGGRPGGARRRFPATAPRARRGGRAPAGRAGRAAASWRAGRRCSPGESPRARRAASGWRRRSRSRARAGGPRLGPRCGCRRRRRSRWARRRRSSGARRGARLPGRGRGARVRRRGALGLGAGACGGAGTGARR